MSLFRIGIMAVGVSVAFFSGGCASIFKGTTQAIPVSSTPAGAAVWLDDKMIGYTPLTAPVRRKSDHLFVLEEEGYLPENVAIIRKLGGAVAGNILLGYVGVVGWGIDAASGAQYNLTPEAVSVNLKPNPAALPKTPVVQTAAARFIEDLRKLDEQHAAKTITDEEFVKRRQARVDQYSKP